MAEATEKRICRYFNTAGGCLFGGSCKFLHITDQKPACKFFVSSGGCRFGENCHFFHDVSLLKVPENFSDEVLHTSTQEFNKENHNPSVYTGSNNNNMEQVNASNSCKVNEGDADCTEFDVYCGSCKRALKRKGNESYCNLLKNHYLEAFLEKEGLHVKCVKLKAGLEHGQLYWCKPCILVFEKPWSLFQHVADKAGGFKVSRMEKKMHLDWLDNIAALMAGHDLGLFTQTKLRTDLRNLLIDNHGEDLSAAVAQMLQLNTVNNFAFQFGLDNGGHLRLQQKEMMRKIEQLHKQWLLKHFKNPGFKPSFNNYQQATLPPYHAPTNHLSLELPMTLAPPMPMPPSRLLDPKCGFTDEEVEELLQQGIKPWDEEADAALAVLRGEMDYLLQ